MYVRNILLYISAKLSKDVKLNAYYFLLYYSSYACIIIMTNCTYREWILLKLVFTK